MIQLTYEQASAINSLIGYVESAHGIDRSAFDAEKFNPEWFDGLLAAKDLAREAMHQSWDVALDELRDLLPDASEEETA